MSEIKCKFCEKILLSNMSRSIHQLRCNLNPEFDPNRFTTPSRRGKYKSNSPSKSTLKKQESKTRLKKQLDTKKFVCQYCWHDITTSTKLPPKFYFKGLRLHESMCGKNPHGKSVMYPTKHSDKTIEKLKESGKKRVWTQEQKIKLSESMKNAVKKHPESYTNSNRGRVKQIIFDNIKFHGKWEVAFYKWSKENNIEIKKNIEGFNYYWRGNRTYFPDFYLPKLELFIEIKGYETYRDQAKWSAFPKKLIVIRKEQILQINKGIFPGIESIPLTSPTNRT